MPRSWPAGSRPLILEYIDMLTMGPITANAGLELGIPQEVTDAALAYLVVVVENTPPGAPGGRRRPAGRAAGRLGRHGRLRAAAQAGAQLISARERAFFVAKAAGADDIIDMVVPRAAIPAYLATVAELAAAHGALVTGCGHVG